mgnify:CR=1 FL=1
MGEKLSKTLAQNKQALEAQFGGTVDLYMKDVQLCGISCCICMFEGLSSIERLWIMMLDSLSKPQVMPRDGKELLTFLHDRTAIPLESNILSTFEEVRTQLTAGTSVILIDGAAQALVLSTQSMQFRSVSEPSGENNLRGSREGFVELLRVNISLVRRLVRTETFMAETLTCGEKTQTELALLYDRKLVSQPLLDEIRRRASQARLPFLFDTGYLAPFLQRGYFSFFQSVGYTERPDTAAAKICEGKIVLMANGSPFAMLIPYFFSENFSSMDDYSEKAYFATLVRCLKYAAFLIAVMLQGVFVSIANFTPELLPKEMLYKIAASEQATPLPLFLEAILVTFLLEIVREAGLRLPKPIGHSVSLVAALIVGDTAVSAGLVGTPVVIVAGLTALCTFWARWALQACFSACWCRPAACMRSASRILRLLRPLPAVSCGTASFALRGPRWLKRHSPCGTFRRTKRGTRHERPQGHPPNQSGYFAFFGAFSRCGGAPFC